MMMTLNNSPTFFEHDKADEIVAEMSADPEDDWTYVADHTGERWARIQILDENGEEVGYL